MEKRNLTASRPDRVRIVAPEPRELWVAGDIDDAPTIAIVGSRDADARAVNFAKALAAAIAAKGAVVVSGGARGIDAAAHRGAMDANGRTWCVAPTGHLHTFPPEHAALFDEIVKKGGAMIWPFSPDVDSRTRGAYQRRNGVLVAMADAIVIVQASIPSGTLNTASWCKKLGRPLFVVGIGPWDDPKAFAGSIMLLESGARPVCSIDGFLIAVGLTKKKTNADARVVYGLPKPPRATLTTDEKLVLDALGNEPIHLDELVLKTALGTSSIATALLTLALENVLVEGPAGFFRRANPAQTLNIPIDIVRRS